jgi:hypothetical protein
MAERVLERLHLPQFLEGQHVCIEQVKGCDAELLYRDLLFLSGIRNVKAKLMGRAA